MPLPPEPGPLRSRRSQGAARKRDGMQLLLIGSQVGKLWFLLAFPLSLSFFNFLFLAFFPPPPPFFFLVLHPPPLLRRTSDFIRCSPRQAPTKKIMSKKRAYVLLPSSRSRTTHRETFAKRVHGGAGHRGKAARGGKAKRSPPAQSLSLLSYGCDINPRIESITVQRGRGDAIA